MIFIKRLLPIVLSVCILLCSCGKSKTTVGLNKNSFFTNFTATFNQLEISGKLSEADGGGYKVNLTAPESLQGLQAVYNNGKVVVEYMGLSQEFQKSDLPEYNMIFNLCDIIDYVTSNSPAAQKTDTGFKISGNLNGAEYTLFTDENYTTTQLKTDGQLPLTVNFNK